MVDNLRGTLYPCQSNGSRIKKFFPQITGRMGYQERVHEQLVDQKQVYVPYEGNLQTMNKKIELVKELTVLEQKRNPKAYEGVNTQSLINE